jgi:hypothetical protein
MTRERKASPATRVMRTKEPSVGHGLDEDFGRAFALLFLFRADRAGYQFTSAYQRNILNIHQYLA